jgi:membrane associated rhomboid family serine protease
VLGRVEGRDVLVGVVASLRQYAITFVVLTILVGLFVPNTNNFAHIGGFLGGVLVGLVLPPQAQVGGRELRLWERVLLGAVIAAGAVALGLAGHNAIEAVNAAPQQFLIQ